MVQAGEVVLCNSEALLYEIGRIPDLTRQAESLSLLSLARENLWVTDDVEVLAAAFERQGIRALDAVHLALASSAKVDYFCTCDDQSYRKASSMSGLSCKVISLLNLVTEVSP